MFYFRWLENERVVLRLIEIWPNIITIVNFWESLLASKRPSSKSYVAMKKGKEDPLIVAKLSLFCYITSRALSYKIPNRQANVAVLKQ